MKDDGLWEIRRWTLGHFRPEDTCRLKVRGWRTIYYANGCQKEARLAICISDKLYFKPKTVIRDEEKNYIIIKRSIQQEDLTIVNFMPPTCKHPNI